jgi:hypothetical protein
MVKKETKKYLLKLEINFLEVLIKNIQRTRRDHDASRDRVSIAINKVVNSDWGDNSQCMKRGELMGNLKSGEVMLNMTYGNLLSAENEISERMAYLREQIKEKEKA